MLLGILNIFWKILFHHSLSVTWLSLRKVDPFLKVLYGNIGKLISGHIMHITKNPSVKLWPYYSV